MKVQIINGPNINLTGKREVKIYGKKSFEDYLIILKDLFEDIQIDYYQSNVEGEIINKVQEAGFDYDGIIINAGGYSHTSVAIADAISSIESPVVEVHISNIYAREEFRQRSLLAANCIGTITGFGLDSYRLAIESIRVYKKK